MKKWLKLAARNILRNKRRSLVTLLAIGVGFAAITVFRGYVSRVYWGLERMAIQGEGLGHLTIFKAGWLEKGKLDPDRYMFSKAETEKIMKLAMGEKEVMLATPQITLSGIISNGSVSTIFIAQGVVPQDDRTIKGTWNAFRPVQGEGLNEKKTYGVEMAQDLAKFLNLAPGKDGVVMAPTMSGQMNAMDIQVSGVFDTGTDATNDKYMRFPFVFAQSLLDTEKAEKIVVLLDDTAKTELMRSRLLSTLANAGIPCEIKTWKELSMFYCEGETDVRHILHVRILHRPRHRGDEHRQYHGYGGSGEDEGDRNLAGPRTEAKGRIDALCNGGQPPRRLRQSHRHRPSYLRLGSHQRHKTYIHVPWQLFAGTAANQLRPRDAVGVDVLFDSAFSDSRHYPGETGSQTEHSQCPGACIRMEGGGR